MTERVRQRFEDLLTRHQNIAWKVARAYCWNAEERRDLVQEIALQLWRAFPGYDERRLFSTWMYRIALNVAISFARKARLRTDTMTPLDQGIDPADEAAGAGSDDRLAALTQVMAGLDPLSRALLMLYLDEYSHREIAGVLGISETNVATKISRLKVRIRAQLAGAAR